MPTAAKAIFASVTTFLTGIISDLSGDAGFGDISTQQWIVVALATIVAFGGVYGISNGAAAAGR
jgi:hypothetical protein